jgi:hypothetical protein
MCVSPRRWLPPVPALPANYWATANVQSTLPPTLQVSVEAAPNRFINDWIPTIPTASNLGVIPEEHLFVSLALRSLTKPSQVLRRVRFPFQASNPDPGPAQDFNVDNLTRAVSGEGKELEDLFANPSNMKKEEDAMDENAKFTQEVLALIDPSLLEITDFPEAKRLLEAAGQDAKAESCVMWRYQVCW